MDKVLFIQQLRKTYLADIQALISLGGNPDLIQEETSLWNPIKTPIKTFHSGPQRKTPLSSSRSDITVSWIMSVDVLDLFFCTILKKKQPRRSNSFLGILFRSHHWPWHWAINQMALVAIRVTCPTPFEATLPSLTIVIFLESKEYYPLHHLPL